MLGDSGEVDQPGSSWRGNPRSFCDPSAAQGLTGSFRSHKMPIEGCGTHKPALSPPRPPIPESAARASPIRNQTSSRHAASSSASPRLSPEVTRWNQSGGGEDQQCMYGHFVSAFSGCQISGFGGVDCWGVVGVIGSHFGSPSSFQCSLFFSLLGAIVWPTCC